MKNLTAFENFTDRNGNLKFKNYQHRNKYGSIRYRIYDDDVAIFMGSYVDKQYRGKGIFKEMLNEVLEKLKNYDVYVPVSNPTIIDTFKKNGFIIYEQPIRYWKQTENSVNMYKPKFKSGN